VSQLITEDYKLLRR